MTRCRTLRALQLSCGVVWRFGSATTIPCNCFQHSKCGQIQFERKLKTITTSPAPAPPSPAKGQRSKNMRKKRQKFISGLDIGTTKICAIIGQLDDDGQVTILGVGSHPSQGLKKGMVVDIEETVVSIQK